MDELIDNGINKLKNISNLYESYDLAQKAKLLGSTFPEKLDFDGINCRTPRINEFVRLTIAVGKGSKKK